VTGTASVGTHGYVLEAADLLRETADGPLDPAGEAAFACSLAALAKRAGRAPEQADLDELHQHYANRASLFEAAAEAYTEILHQAPDLVPALVGLSATRFKQGLFAEATEAARKAVGLSLADASVQRALTYALFGEIIQAAVSSAGKSPHPPALVEEAKAAFAATARLDPRPTALTG